MASRKSDGQTPPNVAEDDTSFREFATVSEILPAQFFDDPELIFAETVACSVVFDQPGNLEDEIDFSSSDEGSDEHPVCGISTLAGLVVVQELRTQDSSADFFNKNLVARHLQICMNHVFGFARRRFHR